MGKKKEKNNKKKKGDGGKKKNKKEDGVCGDKKRVERETRKKMRKRREKNGFASEMSRLRDQLRKSKLRLRSVSPDGNCLFRSVADQFEGKPRNHAKYRSMCCAYMKANSHAFSPFFVPDEDIETFEDYVESMKQDGTWGGQLELKAVADCLQRHLVIWQVDRDRWMIRSSTILKTQCLHLGYTGGVHYDSVRRLDDSDLQTPKPLSPDGKEVDSVKKEDRTLKEKSTCEFLMKSSYCPNIDHVKRVLLLHNGKVEDALKQLIQEREECEGEWRTITKDVVELKHESVDDDETSTTKTCVKKKKEKKKRVKKIPRNKTCPLCNSGKKYKNCCKPGALNKKKKNSSTHNDEDEGIERAMTTLCV